MGGVVCTSERHAARAGAAALTAGGNAVDAALTAAVALTVCEPTSNGLGGDLFALVWDGQTVHALDATGRSPAALPVAAIRRAGGQMPTEGWPAVTVPGQASGWEALHARFGQLDWGKVVAPAVRLARDGFEVGPVTAAAWARAATRFEEAGEWQRVFRPDGRTPAAGERFRNPDLAMSLEVMARDGAGAFYAVLGPKIVAWAEASGGWLSASDLAAQRARWVAPLSMGVGAWTVVGMGPPSQGVVALEALGLLEGLAAVSDHAAIESVKLAFRDAYAVVADPDHMEMDIEALLSPAHLARRRAQIGPGAAPPGPATGLSGGTVLVCTADDDGRMVSLIQSNYMGFGSGIVVPGTGIALQNRGAGFRLQPGHPNDLGAAKRPFHTLLPGLILDQDGKGWAAFGCMGGQMQPQGQVQIVSALAAGEAPQDALDRPRWRWLDQGSVVVEAGFDPARRRALADRGHAGLQTRAAHHFGGAQLVIRDGSHLVGATDRRKDGEVCSG